MSNREGVGASRRTVPFVEHLRRSLVAPGVTQGALRDPGLWCNNRFAVTRVSRCSCVKIQPACEACTFALAGARLPGRFPARRARLRVCRIAKGLVRRDAAHLLERRRCSTRSTTRRGVAPPATRGTQKNAPSLRLDAPIPSRFDIPVAWLSRAGNRPGNRAPSQRKRACFASVGCIFTHEQRGDSRHREAVVTNPAHGSRSAPWVTPGATNERRRCSTKGRVRLDAPIPSRFDIPCSIFCGSDHPTPKVFHKNHDHAQHSRNRQPPDTATISRQAFTADGLPVEVESKSTC